MQQRSDNAIAPYLAAAGIILSTPILFIFAVWVYKIIRPHEKIGEVWERNLAEEALLDEVESIHHCPTATDASMTSGSSVRPAGPGSTGCARTAARLVGMDWSLCAWCGKDFERREAPAAIEAGATRRESTPRAERRCAGQLRSERPRAGGIVGPRSGRTGSDRAGAGPDPRALTVGGPATRTMARRSSPHP